MGTPVIVNPTACTTTATTRDSETTLFQTHQGADLYRRRREAATGGTAKQAMPGTIDVSKAPGSATTVVSLFSQFDGGSPSSIPRMHLGTYQQLQAQLGLETVSSPVIRS